MLISRLLYEIQGLVSKKIHFLSFGLFKKKVTVFQKKMLGKRECFCVAVGRHSATNKSPKRQNAKSIV